MALASRTQVRVGALKALSVSSGMSIRWCAIEGVHDAVLEGGEIRVDRVLSPPTLVEPPSDRILPSSIKGQQSPPALSKERVDPMAVYGEVQRNLPSGEEGCCVLPPKKDQSLRRAISEILEDTGSIVEDLQQQASKNSSEPQMIDCECCGMSETPRSALPQAVKEQVKKKPMESMQEALEAHMALCMKFNKTIRINPQLSLASSMRDIARRELPEEDFFGLVCIQDCSDQ
ncbi:hypothetical protein Taro_051163 [Colocasia esculenta]|uniref:Uncharacterized protein n=1 Tax=Colocasia esculenta TaxID=4460 RepID=A0A843XFT6_COLES|nr:hypothetical protein [Colocasia esculenta]